MYCIPTIPWTPAEHRLGVIMNDRIVLTARRMGWTMVDERQHELADIGQALKTARGDRGWSLRYLADRAGVSASLISGVENARIVPTVASLFAISDALEVPAGTFLPERHLPASRNASIEPTLPTSAPEVSRSRGAQHDRLPDHVSETVQRERPEAPDPTTDRVTIARPRRIRRVHRVDRRHSTGVSPVGLGSDGVPAPPELSGTTVGRQPSGSVMAPPVPSGLPAPAALTSEPTRMPAGVRIVEPAIMRLANGSSWRLLAAIDRPGARVIAVHLVSDQSIVRPFRTAASSLVLQVLSGELIVEADFQHVSIRPNLTIRIETGVPYRLSPGRDEPHFLLVVGEDWNGSV